MLSLDGATEVDDVAVLDDVFLAFQTLQMPGLGFLDRSGLEKVVVGGNFGADEALGEIGVDLAGGGNGCGAALQVPATHFRLSGREEGDDPDGVVGAADDSILAQLGDTHVGHERSAFVGIELRKLELELGVDGQSLGGKGLAVRPEPAVPAVIFRTTTSGLSVKQAE